jgi:hypothetical protein
MVDQHALMLARVEVPLELWIILVVCTGGIYLIIALVRAWSNRSSDAKPTSVQEPSKIDLDLLLVEIVTAVLQKDEAVHLSMIWRNYPVSAEGRTRLVAMVKLTLAELFDEEAPSAEKL